MEITSAAKSDGGYASRKLWYAVGTSICIFIIGVVGATWSSFRPMIETIVGGELGALALYLGGNVSSKFVMAKHGLIAKQDDGDGEETPPAEPHPEENK